jgi:hypothetical protein
MDLHLGFGGILTFKKADEIRRIAADVPSDRFLMKRVGIWLTATFAIWKPISPKLPFFSGFLNTARSPGHLNAGQGNPQKRVAKQWLRPNK